MGMQPVNVRAIVGAGCAVLVERPLVCCEQGSAARMTLTGKRTGLAYAHVARAVAVQDVRGRGRMRGLVCLAQLAKKLACQFELGIDAQRFAEMFQRLFGVALAKVGFCHVEVQVLVVG